MKRQLLQMVRGVFWVFLSCEFISVLACPADTHLCNLSVAVLSCYSFNSSRRIAGLQPCTHHALCPTSLLHLAMYFDFLFPPAACRDVWGPRGERSRRRM